MAEYFPLDDGEAYDPRRDRGEPGALLPPLVQPLADLPLMMGGAGPEAALRGFDAGEVAGLFGEFEGQDWATEDPQEHEANLAQFLPSTMADRLAMNVIEWVDQDKASRRGWEQREEEGIRKLGLSRADVRAMQGADPVAEWRSSATHPGLMKACIQFWARAFTELYPAGGPCKAVVMGASTAEREQQALRVSGFLNYLYTQKMPGAMNEASQAYFRLPLSGSVFRKVYFDPVLGTICVKFLESQDFVKPYSATDLGSAPRYTHIVRWTRNDLNQAIARGYYLDVVRGEPTYDHGNRLERAIDEATGVTPIDSSGDHDAEQATPDTGYEMSVTLDLADYDWTDPLAPTLTDARTQATRRIGVPYLVTVHVESQRVLSMRRDWRATDRTQRRRRNVIESKFLPGFGGYGFGLLHIAAGLSDAQTGFLRYLLDACTLHTIGSTSGYVSQSAVGMKGLKPLRIGEFQTVPLGAAEMKAAFWSPQFNWQSNNTLQVLEYLDRLLDFLVAATEAVVGEDNNNMPVGTMLARREERTLPFRSIFVSLHGSQGEELRAVAELAADYLPPRYPYAVPGAEQWVFAADFDERVDVVPVSDPNIISSSQRMAQAQFLFEQAQVLFRMAPTPDVWDKVLMAYQHLLETMRVPEPARFLPQRPAPPPDPLAAPAVPEPPPGPDPVAAEIVRKDTATAAEIRRKDAATAAQIAREAERMNWDAQRRDQGDRAIQAQEEASQLTAMEQQIIQEAQARRLNLAQQQPSAGGAP